MNNNITATHENGSILTHKATDKDVEYAIALMKECGYIRFRIETPGEAGRIATALNPSGGAKATTNTRGEDMVNGVWSDEYNGERFTYYSPLRPLTPTLLPKGTVYIMEVGRDPRIIVTTAPLPSNFVEQASLEKR